MGLEKIVGESWAEILEKEFQSDYMREISRWISYNRESKTIYPDKEDVFKALKLTPFDKVKVIILGLEPYANGEADGLCFSYKNGLGKGRGIQSLDLILNEIENDCYNGLNVNKNYQLNYLAEQGVLLLNSILTVFRGQVGSHKDLGWQKLTTKIINLLIEDITPKVFMLWGKDAQNIFYNTDYVRTHTDRYLYHLILNAYHPAYDLHKRDSVGRIIVNYPNGFSGGKYFSKANEYLLSKLRGQIDWIEVETNVNIEKPSDKSPF